MHASVNIICSSFQARRGEQPGRRLYLKAYHTMIIRMGVPTTCERTFYSTCCCRKPDLFLPSFKSNLSLSTCIVVASILIDLLRYKNGTQKQENIPGSISASRV